MPPLVVAMKQPQYSNPQESTYESIGVSSKGGWYTSAISNSALGALALALYAFTSSIPEGVAIVGLVALLASPLFVLGARYAPPAAIGAHIRCIWGITLLGTGLFLLGDLISAMALMMLYYTLVIAYMQKPAFAIPYGIAGTAVLAAGLALNADLTMALTTTLVVAMLTAAAIFSQYQLRSIAGVSRWLSVTDALTGCANLRRLRLRMQDAAGSRTSGAGSATLFVLDLDDFKEVNDRFSHTLGDEQLKAVAAALQAELDPSDLLVRRGGDEFAVLCLSMDGRDPGTMRLRLERAIARARKEVCPQVNTSGSVAFVARGDGEAVDALLARADDALHKAKLGAHAGRSTHSAGARVQSIDSYRTHEREHSPARQADHLAGSTADQLAEELRISRWARRSLGTTLAWEQAAAMNLIIGTALAVFAVWGITPELQGFLASIAVGALLLSALPCALAARRQLSRIALLMAIIATLGAMTIAISNSGAARAALVNFYLVPVMFAFYFLRARHAIPVLVVGLALFIWMLAASGYPYFAVRTITTTAIVLLMVSMLAKLRKITRDFTEQAIDMSVADPLTGVANLRGLRQYLADAIDRCAAGGGRLALLAIDLDDFKSVNDRYSHTRGDAVLVATAAAIRSVIRDEELVARRGGDEFAAVCEFDDLDNARAVVLRVAEAISECRRALCPDLTSTASVGYITWKPGESCDMFLARADRELHGAKERTHAAVQVS